MKAFYIAIPVGQGYPGIKRARPAIKNLSLKAG